MKIFAYALRPYDELGYLDALSRELGFEYDWTTDYPTLENAGLAAGADGVCIITNPMTPDLLAAYRELGVRGLATRSIGYDHIDLLAARELGIRVAHAAYPPEGVANYAIMLMLMALRKIKLVMRCAAAQDFSLAGKIGRDLSSCTVGVVGTGAIGACVIRHLQGFGCRVLACDPVKRDELRALATYVSLPELLAASDVVTLHAPGLPENHHMIGGTELALMRQGAVLVNAARAASWTRARSWRPLSRAASAGRRSIPLSTRRGSATWTAVATRCPTGTVRSSPRCPTSSSRRTWRSTRTRTWRAW